MTECRIEQHDAWYKVFFPYNLNLINSIKTIPGRRYEPSECCWILPATPESKTLLIQTLGPLAKLVFKTPEALKTVKATNAVKTSEVDPFYEHLSRRRYSPNTIKNYLHHASCFHEFCLKQKGNCQEQVTAYFNHLVQERKASSAYQHMAVNAIQL